VQVLPNEGVEVRFAADDRAEPFAQLIDHNTKAAMGGNYPSLVTFGPAGCYDPSIRFFDDVKLLKRLVNADDAKSLVAHPASTPHRQLDDPAQARVGFSPEMIRLSIGLEHADDIIDDIDRALDASRGGW
jgi:O-acetylhomoserine (thiol)-lyase